MAKQIVCGKLYASWCHFCKDLKEPWNQLISILNKEMPMVCIVKDIAIGDEEDEQKRNSMLENLTSQLKANQKINVQKGYPTIFKLDDNNNVVYHEGNRTVDDMYQFFTGRPLKHPGQNLLPPRAPEVVKKTQGRRRVKKRKSLKQKQWQSHPRRRKTRRARKPRKF